MYKNLISSVRFEEVRKELYDRVGCSLCNPSDQDVENFFTNMHRLLNLKSPIPVGKAEFKELIDFSDTVEFYLKEKPEKRIKPNEDPGAWRLSIADEMWGKGYSISRVCIAWLTMNRELSDMVTRFRKEELGDLNKQYTEYRLWLSDDYGKIKPMTKSEFRELLHRTT